MNTHLRPSFAAVLFLSLLMLAHLCWPTAAAAQTAYGTGALSNNTSGTFNSAFGYFALYSNTSGSGNTATGQQALVANTTGYENTADGVLALFSNTTGTRNTAQGLAALFQNTTGNNNIALGYYAGQYITTGSNNIAIGNYGQNTDSGVIRLGTPGTHTATFIAGITQANASRGVPVFINADGQLGIQKSSRRFKHDIHDMGGVSDRLLRLRPVTFRYNEAASDGTHPVEYGLIAEEVAKVYPNLVQYDKAGKPFTIYYQQLTPLLLNELQKAHRGSEAQKAESAAQRAQIASLRAQLRAQGSELAALKRLQEQQLAALAKLTSLVATSRPQPPSAVAQR
jgi:hypothetical protein